MKTLTPNAVVLGATRTPLPYGLFSVMAFRPADSDRWEGGVTWDSPGCGNATGGIGPWACVGEDESVTGLPKDLSREDGPLGEATPFTVYGHYNCSPVGMSLSDGLAKAEANLANGEEAQAERALWTGELGSTPALAVGAEVIAESDTTPVKPHVAVALLEQYIADNYGSLGVIHASRSLALRLAQDKAGTGRLTTRLGTPIVAGAGYPGTGPDATEPLADFTKQWAYASPALFGYRSDVFTSSNRPGDLLDRAHNDLYAVAERTYLIGYDPCGVGAVQIDLTA